MDADRQDRSLAALLTDLQRETARMIQQEFALARAETGERVRSSRWASACWSPPSWSRSWH